MRKFDKDISAVFPAYNEEENIEPCVLEARAILNELVRDFEIIIVNDGSTDNTGAVCAGLEKKFDKVRVVSKARNEGYGYALRDGFRAARFDLVFFSDADRQFDIYNLKDLLEYCDKFDIVIGYRKNRQDPLTRKLASSCYNLLVRGLFGLKVRDINCAFKIFHKEIFERISIESNQYVVNMEILAKARALGYSVKEVAVSRFPRREGRSKVGAFDACRTIREVARIRKGIAAKGVR